MLTQSFDELAFGMQDAIDGPFGECVTIKPMINRPNQRGIRDKSRGEVTLTVTWQKKSFRTDIDTDSRLGGSNGLSFSTVSAYRVFFYAKVCDFDVEPRQNDIVVRHKTGDEYEIHDITNDGAGTFKIELHERGIYGMTA